MATITLYMYQEQYVGFEDPEIRLIPWHIDIGEEISKYKARFFLEKIELEIPDIEFIPTKTINGRLVKILEEEKKSVQAAAQVQLNELNDKIQQLLAITYVASTSPDEDI